MVYGFVKQSGGNIQIYSELGHGTSVRLYLPLAEGAAAGVGRTARQNARPALPKGPRRSSRGGRPAPAQGAGHAAGSLGYNIIEADNGAAAMAEIATRPEIALVFTDMVMPGGMSGSNSRRRRLS